VLARRPGGFGVNPQGLKPTPSLNGRVAPEGPRITSDRLRRAFLLLLPLALLALWAPKGAWAHAALLAANPAPGADLRTSPQAIRLSFSEPIEVSVSAIEVLDSSGKNLGHGAVRAAGSNRAQLALSPALARGTYTVNWRVISSDDGHATSGSYEFGVDAAPSGSVSSTSSPGTSSLEIVARFFFLAGLILLTGAAAGTLGRFAGASGFALAAAGWAVALAGLLLLAEAQRRTAGSALGDFLGTSAGAAIVRRALALAGAGVALFVAWRRPGKKRAALGAAGAAGLVAVAFHVGAGHAAAGPWSSALTITAQVAHFAAAGIWLGGLAALLVGFRGAPQAASGGAARRFGAVAAAGLVVVVATGTLRAIDELSEFGQLTSTGYGRAVLAKLAVFGLIALLALRNRNALRASGFEPRSLAVRARAELGLAAVAIALAAVLGSTAPPTAATAVQPPGLTAAATDRSGTVHATLTTVADRPGPNRFALEVSGAGEEANSVSLRFTPLDDPNVAPSTLRLHPSAGGAFAGAGSNLKFDGRWRVAAEIGLADRTVAVPLELDVPGPKNFVSVQHIPGQPAKYTMQIGSVGSIRIEPVPERPGPSRVHVSVYTAFGGVSDVATIVVTGAAAGSPTERLPVERLTKGRFVATARLATGTDTVTVIAHTRDGTRLRGEFHLKIPE
jgi:copper transport protein